MKYLVSLTLLGLFFINPVIAQNFANNGPRILDQVSVVTSTAEDLTTEISTRELAVMESSMNDYSTSIWSREIYRQVGKEVMGNETFFYPDKSTEDQVNLFSLIINLLSTNTITAYKYTDQPNRYIGDVLSVGDILADNLIPYTENNDNTFNVPSNTIPTEQVIYYLVKEKWFFDIKTAKGDIRVTDICPVMYDKGRYYPLFWVSFDDLSTYLARAACPEAVSANAPQLVNASLFDLIRNRYYKGCIYQVGLRHLSKYFPEMQDLINERRRIENELDYIQSKFYAAQRRR